MGTTFAFAPSMSKSQEQNYFNKNILLKYFLHVQQALVMYLYCPWSRENFPFGTFYDIRLNHSKNRRFFNVDLLVMFTSNVVKKGGTAFSTTLGDNRVNWQHPLSCFIHVIKNLVLDKLIHQQYQFFTSSYCTYYICAYAHKTYNIIQDVLFHVQYLSYIMQYVHMLQQLSYNLYTYFC